MLKALSSVVTLLKRHSMDRVGDAWRQYDAVVSKHVFSMLSRMGYAEARKPASPLTRGKPLIDSPTPMITLATAYLLIVILGTLFYRIKGPKKQKSDPLWLRVLVQVHNTFLVILSSYMSLTTAYCAWKYSYRFWGQGYSSSEKDMGWIIYVFFLSKIYEFMDTFIMLLKGKTEQITFLHVYHHGTISAIWWAIAYGAPGGDAWYSAFLNSLVHVVMYTYYLAATIVGKDAKKKRKYLWWGRYVTQFQMLQFVSMMIQAGYILYIRSPYPRFLSSLLFFYMITLLALFANFYMKKHGGKKRSSPRKKMN